MPETPGLPFCTVAHVRQSSKWITKALVNEKEADWAVGYNRSIVYQAFNIIFMTNLRQSCASISGLTEKDWLTSMAYSSESSLCGLLDVGLKWAHKKNRSWLWSLRTIKIVVWIIHNATSLTSTAALPIGVYLITICAKMAILLYYGKKNYYLDCQLTKSEISPVSLSLLLFSLFLRVNLPEANDHRRSWRWI